MKVLIRFATVAATCAVGLSMGVAAQADPATEQSGSEGQSNQQVAIDPNTGAQRSAVPIEGFGLKLNTQDGDRVVVTGSQVTWSDSGGVVVATITLSAESGSLEFSYDETSHLIRPKFDSDSVHDPEGFAQCMPKWWGWAYNIAWGTLVCLPLSAGATGAGTPIAGAITATACEAAGGALTTAAAC